MLEYILSVLVGITGIAMSLGHFVQAYKIFKTKTARDISLVTYTTFTIGTYVWLLYAITLRDPAIIVSFIIGSIGTTLVMFFTVRYR